MRMISDSNGNHYGQEFKNLLCEFKNKQSGSESRHRLCRQRSQYINKVVDELPWDELSVIGVEDLKNLKKGKNPKRSKSFRKSVAPWVYRQVLRRIKEKAEENRVLVVSVPPAYTSQTCPSCRVVQSRNRKGESYKCSCGYSGDADTVGALEVLARTLLIVREFRVPGAPKVDCNK